jgi:hypothetical protein
VQGSDLDVLLRGRFFKIIDSNPDQEIMDFAAKARSGEVRVKFGQMPPNKLAIFHLWPIDGDMTLGGRQLDRFIPEIVINLAFIIKVGQPDGLRLFQVMLDHEYRHYRQFMMTTDESLRHSYIAARPVAGQPISARICAFNWQNEIDAYRHSYEKAVRWGFHDDFSARVGDAKSFNQLVFKNISPNAATMSPECLPVWAKAAGHPHPEAFEP